MTNKNQNNAINPYFFIPFMVWVLVGGILLALFTREELFFAVNRHFSDTANTCMYYITWMGQGEIIVPVLLALMFVLPYSKKTYFLNALLTNIIPFFTQQLLKVYFNHPRPLSLYANKYWVHMEPWWTVLMSKSFPSGHSEGAFSFFCFLSLVLPKELKILGLPLFFMALSVCYSRMYLGAHFFEDVYTGSIIGALSTTLIFSFLNRTSLQLNNKTTTSPGNFNFGT